MSPAFIKGVKEHLSEQGQETNKVSADNSVEESNTAIYAQSRVDSSTLGLVTAMPKSLHQPQIIFDRYHIVAKANEAVDEVRRSEVKTRPELNPSRYAWLKNESNLTARQRERLTWLARPSMQLKTTRAARWRDDFNGFYEQLTPGDAEPYLRRWCYGAKRSRLEPIKNFVRLVEAHWDGGSSLGSKTGSATGC